MNLDAVLVLGYRGGLRIRLHPRDFPAHVSHARQEFPVAATHIQETLARTVFQPDDSRRCRLA